MKQPARKRLHDAIDALADLYEGGQLLAATQPEVLLRMAVEEISRTREMWRMPDPAWDDSSARKKEQ